MQNPAMAIKAIQNSTGLLYENVTGREQCPRSAVSVGAVMTSPGQLTDRDPAPAQQPFPASTTPATTPATTPTTTTTATATTTVLLSFSDISTLNCGLEARSQETQGAVIPVLVTTVAHTLAMHVT